MAGKIITNNTNTIAGGFNGGGNSRSSQRKYISQVFASNIISISFTKSSQGKTGVNIIFSEEDALEINPHDDDPLVIIVQLGN